jgi:hypothetical protein
MQDRRTEIEGIAIWQNVMTFFEQFERHLLDEILVFANLIQIPAFTAPRAEIDP